MTVNRSSQPRRRELTWATWHTQVGAEETDALPRIVVVYDVTSITPMVLAEAASGLCRIVWVVDGSDPVMGPLVRLLRRIGEVVDTAGLDADAVAAAVAPHEPSGILTFAEAQMPFTAAMAERLSLTYHSVRDGRPAGGQVPAAAGAARRRPARPRRLGGADARTG